MVMDISVINQRTVMLCAYTLMLENAECKKFRSRDIANAAGVDVAHTAALIRKCFLAGLINKKGMKGRTMIYELTKRGMDRGEYYFNHWNQITNEFY